MTGPSCTFENGRAQRAMHCVTSEVESHSGLTVLNAEELAACFAHYFSAEQIGLASFCYFSFGGFSFSVSV